MSDENNSIGEDSQNDLKNDLQNVVQTESQNEEKSSAKVEELGGNSHLNSIINRLKRPENPNALAVKLSNILSKASAVSSVHSLPDKTKGPRAWYGVVNVAVIEAKNLVPPKSNNLPDPFVRLKLGMEKFKTKNKSKTLSPRWTEDFDLYLYEDPLPTLELSIRNTEMGSKEDVIGECSLNLTEYEEETTHVLNLPLDDDNGTIFILLSISYVGTNPDSKTSFNKPKTQLASEKWDFVYFKSFTNMDRVGWMQINVIKAIGLAAADLRGTSDPYCVLQLDNNRIQTQTIYKTVSPEWNAAFSMNIRDIHSSLTIRVLDENKNRKIEFLGMLSIPLLEIKNGEMVWYQLKDVHMMGRAKGVLLLQIHYVYNPIRAAVRTFHPKELLHMKQEPKLKISVMKSNVEKARKVCLSVAQVARLVNSCLNWESKTKSMIAYVVYCAGALFLELYMLPLILILIITKNFVTMQVCNSFRDCSDCLNTHGEADEMEEDLDSKEERKSILEKFQGLQEVGLVVQEVVGEVVSLLEKIRNMFLWRSPWLTCLGLFLLILLTIVLFLIPPRLLLLIWGTRKFSKKLINPKYEDNNEMFDYFTRLPSDKDLLQRKELQPDAWVMAVIKREELKLKSN